MSIAAYQTLYQSSALLARVVELKNKCEAIERREAERRAVDERKRKEEIDFLKPLSCRWVGLGPKLAVGLRVIHWHQQQHLESFLKSHDSK
eukprot:Skav204506  [mRNA]  locus=scaffold527:250873:254223:+ [translate_table: standard]